MLIEWDVDTLNLKYITHIRRSVSGLKYYLDIFILGNYDANTCDGTISYHYDDEEERDSDYATLMKLIKESSNLNIDNEGRFVCSHCGAPN